MLPLLMTFNLHAMEINCWPVVMCLLPYNCGLTQLICQICSRANKPIIVSVHKKLSSSAQFLVHTWLDMCRKEIQILEQISRLPAK